MHVSRQREWEAPAEMAGHHVLGAFLVVIVQHDDAHWKSFGYYPFGKLVPHQVSIACCGYPGVPALEVILHFWERFAVSCHSYARIDSEDHHSDVYFVVPLPHSRVTALLAAILHFWFLEIIHRYGVPGASTAILHFSVEVAATLGSGVKCQMRQAVQAVPEASSALADLAQKASHRHCQNPDQVLLAAIAVVVKIADQHD